MSSASDSENIDEVLEDVDFFDPTVHRTKKISKDEAWMGVFGDETTLTSDTPFSKNVTPKEVKFVSSKKEFTDEKEDSIQPRIQKYTTPPILNNKNQHKILPKNQPRGNSLGKDYAAFLDNPNGDIVLNMMKKMGYKKGQGLGSEGQGRVAPVEIKMRGKQFGLGFGAKDDSPEKSSESEIEEDEQLPRQSNDSQPRKSKIIYKTLDEAMARVEREIVVDMRGSTSTHPTALGEDIRLVIDLSKDSLSLLQKKMKTTNVQRRVLIQEVESLQPLLDQAQLDQQSLHELGELCTRLEAIDNILDLPAFGPYLTLLQDRLPCSSSPLADFISMRIFEMATSLIAPLFRMLVADWDPISEPTQFITFFREWPRLFSAGQDIMTPFDALLHHIWLPKVRAFLVNDWVPQQHESALSIIQSWAPPLVSVSLYEHILDQYVLPKLQTAIEAYNPRLDSIPFHIWFHPWLPMLVDKIDSMRPIIRAKLASIIRDIDLFNSDIDVPNQFIVPWIPILSSKDKLKLLDKAAMSKLLSLFESRFIIDPSDQKIDNFVRAMYWIPLFPPQKFGDLIAKAFFPKFHKVLEQWLAMSPPISEVMEWYFYWKSLFPTRLLQAPKVEDEFRISLIRINIHLDSLA